MASVSAYDSAHRVRQTLMSDGTRTDLTLDGWNRTRSATTKNGAQILATYSASFVGLQLQHVDDNARKQDFTWDGAGRTPASPSVRPSACWTIAAGNIGLERQSCDEASAALHLPESIGLLFIRAKERMCAWIAAS